MPTVLAFLGSSRSDGCTRQVLDAVLGDAPVEVIDLAAYRITPYDYQHRNANDDFLPLAERMAQAQVLIFATPVYWYSMSAQLKTFIDRFTDLITVRKDLGRALHGTRLYVIAASASAAPPPGFEVPFRLTCDYLSMEWGGLFHGSFEQRTALLPDEKAAAQAFGKRIVRPPSTSP